MTFTKKNLRAAETVGNYLAELLENSGIALSDLGPALKVREKYLEALFLDRFEDLPDLFYARHLVKRLVVLLNGSPEYAEKLFEEQAGERKESEAPQLVFERRKVGSFSLIVVARVLAAVGLAFVFLGLLGYLGFSAYKALTPPALTVTFPATDIVTQERSIVVKGHTEREVRITVNDQVVTSDDRGEFQTPLFLDPGLNIIEVHAAKRYSRDQVVYRKVLVETPHP
ncbi:MAG: helix-turn-helix domain-containing protein [bacterium]